MNRQPTWPKSPKQSTGRASMWSPRTNVLICVLMDRHRRPVCAGGHRRTHKNSHGCHVCADSPRGPKSPEQSTGRVSVLSPTTNVLICVLIDSHGRPVFADGHTQTHTDSPGCPVCADGHTRTAPDVLQPMWAKITQAVHGKGQRAESKDQRADMCTEGQSRTSYSTRGPKSPKQSTGRASLLSLRTNVLICVLMDSHRRPVCADGHTRTDTDSHRRHVCADGHPRTQPTLAKITRTVHGKGQRADMCTDGRSLCADGHTWTSCVC
ncbi:hypothetical protein IGI04_042384 [Brassica rapa subsp. trilocularis]|uniref:Uncharacterized protein n=1 Tax=Brassica rapa subsp. trilocularis TaxID=1813537 RepID=A0ABQ7KIF8_BRACM|nr:hypothetical protein IGI04_042384 [Brassica rapa subsp. trilocularis]